MTASIVEMDRARQDPVVFADLLIGQPLWPHQIEVVRSPARYRCLCAGRRAGKTRVFGVLSLHRAFAVPWSKVLIVSASDTSAKRMFADISGMAATSPHLSVSLADETTHLLTLSNGSTIECVPSSMKAVRSAEADLLIVDEAGFVDQSIWEAAEPVVGARPGGRVLLASTPWGSYEHFFRRLWQQGMSTPDTEVASWHWPTTANPQIDLTWLEGVRQRSSSDYYTREYLAEWTDEAGVYFTEAELMDAVAGYEMPSLEDLRAMTAVDFFGQRCLPAVGGIDWGYSHDANALLLLSPLDDFGLNADLLGLDAYGRPQRPMFVSFVEARTRWAWSEFIDHVVDVASVFDVQVLASETNGVGAYPTEDLTKRIGERVHGGTYGGCAVDPVWTDVRRKQTGFGKLKSLLQSRRLVLPAEPELLKQLRSLQFEQLPGGSTRISVPESLGHDDLALAAMQAVSAVTVAGLVNMDGDDDKRERPDDLVHTPSGLIVPRAPLPDRGVRWFAARAAGREGGDGW